METPAGKHGFQPEGQKACMWGGGGIPADHPCGPETAGAKRRAHGPHVEQPEGTQGRVGPATQTGKRQTRGLGLGQPSFVSIIQYESLHNYLCPLLFKNNRAEIRKN